MRKICLIIASILIFSLLSSCASEMSLMDFIPSNDNYKGFGGYEFVIKGQWPHAWTPEIAESSGVAQSVGSDALIAHNAKIMEEYDCKIKGVLNETWDWPYYLYLDYLADTVDYDLMDVELFLQINNIKAGYLAAWNDYGLDMTDYDKYGPEGYLKGAADGDDYYGIFSAYRLAPIQYKGVMGVNSNLLKQFYDTSVLELYESGQWTYDNFQSILKLCSTDENIVPLLYYDDRVFMMSAILANGSHIVNYNESTGKYVYGLHDSKTVKALEYVKGLVDEGYTLRDTGGNPELDWSYYFEKAGVVPFYMTESWTLGGDIENMDIVCFPFGPDAEYGKVVSSYRSVNDRYLFMPTSAYNDEVARFVDIWFEEYDTYTKADIMLDFKTYNFYNDESFENYMNLALNAQFDYSFALYDVYDSFMNAISEAVFDLKSLVEAIDSHADRVQECIDANLNK